MPFSYQELNELMRQEREKHPHVVRGAQLHARWEGSQRPYKVWVLEDIRYLRVADSSEPDWSEIERRVTRLAWTVRLGTENLRPELEGLLYQSLGSLILSRTITYTLPEASIRQVFVNTAGVPLLDPAGDRFSPCVTVSFTSGETSLVHPSCLFKTRSEAEAIAIVVPRNRRGFVRKPVVVK